MNFHVGGESSGCGWNVKRLDDINELREELFAERRIGGAIERRAAAFSRFGGDGEVADQQHRAADLPDVLIEMLLAIAAAEDAQAGELFRHPGNLAGCVVALD